jgi:hypothetical protein
MLKPYEHDPGKQLSREEIESLWNTGEITPLHRIRRADRPFMTLDNFDCGALYGRKETMDELR